MARISTRKLSPKSQNQMFFLFWKTLADFKRPRDLEFLTNDLFSPVEKIMIAKRFMIALLLARGLTFRQICQSIKVSPNTVNAVAHKVNRKSRSYGRMVESLVKKSDITRILSNFS